MQYSRNYQTRSKVKKYLFPFLKGIGIVAGLLVVVIAVVLQVRSLLTRQMTAAKEKPIIVAEAEVPEPDASSEIDGKYYGLCSKNSVHSIADFRKTVMQDSALTSHFSGFNWEKARVGRLDQETWTYVSYRKDEIIRQTSRPVKLPKGDEYITDGRRTVRTFCCNDYVAAPPPRQVSMAEEPPATPVERVDGPPRRMSKAVEESPLPPLVPGAIQEELAPTLPDSITRVYHFPDVPRYAFVQQKYSGSRQPNGHDHTVVPEPGTFYLLGSGVAAACLIGALRRRNERESDRT